MEKHRSDPAPLQTLDELALCRALLEDWLNRYERFREQLEAWNADQDTGRPATIPDIADCYRLLSEISKMVRRVEEGQSQRAIPLAKVEAIVFEMGRMMRTMVGNDELADRIRNAWLSIHVAV